MNVLALLPLAICLWLILGPSLCEWVSNKLDSRKFFLMILGFIGLVPAAVLVLLAWVLGV
jgi:hypothetical protein